jgi:hypothetical protein
MYGSPVWDPYQQNLSDTLELVQRRSARRILHDFSLRSSATALVQKLGLLTLSERRTIDKAAMVYRVINDHVDIQGDAFFKPTSRTTRGQQNKFLVPQSRTNVHLHSFFPSAIRLWNTLPAEVAASPSVPALKASMGRWLHS